MNSCKFRIGDRVRVKSIEQLKSTYRSIGDTLIDCNVYGFALEMSYLCGRTATIEKITPYRNGYDIKLANWSNNKLTHYYFCEEMLELVERIIPRILDEEE